MNHGIQAASALLATTLLATGCAPEIPENQPIREARWLEQNWSPHERFWFHHATQGTSTFPVPYDWFVALEQPTIKLFGEVPLLRDPEYLRRFGFIPSIRTDQGDADAMRTQGYSEGAGRTYGSPARYDHGLFPGNEHGLPVGFARTPGTQNPISDQDLIGLTCAACHTGHLEYEGVSIRVDGAPAIIDLEKFRAVLGLAMAYTKQVPGRFGRFADRVLGPDHTVEQRDQLKEALTQLIERGKALKDATSARESQLEKTTGKSVVNEGFGRLDALNRIGNQVFTKDLIGAKDLIANGEPFQPFDNWALIDAPVNFPHIWSTSWFLWVQYDASIEQPMVRNAGEALGVAAQINLGQDPHQNLYQSSVQVKEIYAMESLLAGSEPPTTNQRFAGLTSPGWPEEILGPIDGDRVERGRLLYQQHCRGCHLPPTVDPGFWSDEYWTQPNHAGQRYLKLVEIPVTEIGTDPGQATILATRRVKVPAYLGVTDAPLCDGRTAEVETDAPFATALASVVEQTTRFWYDTHDIPPAEREWMDGSRPNCVKAGSVYKARPLNGIWATPPFLHNGSVPTLYDLLSPVAERTSRFCLGSRQYDPRKVGYDTGCVGGDFELDTGIDGNRNTGHEFRDAPAGSGVIGPALSEEERWDLISYLKTL